MYNRKKLSRHAEFSNYNQLFFCRKEQTLYTGRIEHGFLNFNFLTVLQEFICCQFLQVLTDFFCNF